MNSKFIRPVFVTICFLLAAPLLGIAEETYGIVSHSLYDNTTLAARDNYELKFLGVALKNRHEGIFLLIWKGKKAVNIYGYGYDKNKFLPSNYYSIHHSFGWQAALGPPCGTGVGPYVVSPGQVITMSAGLDWLEDKMPTGLPQIEGADRAVMYVNSSSGELVSDEFPLPLPVKSLK